MCGRLFGNIPANELVRVARTSRTHARFNPTHVVGSYNIAPTSNLPVITHKSCPHYTNSLPAVTSASADVQASDSATPKPTIECETPTPVASPVPSTNTQKAETTAETSDSIRQLTLLHWGWPEYKLINCRGEELQEKPLFIPHLNSRRCVVVVQGVFEWTPEKEPYKYVPKSWRGQADEGLPQHVFLAALYNSHGNVILLTTEANNYLGKVHHRMPVFLTEEEIDRWIDPSVPFSQVIRPVLDHHHPKWDQIECSPITKIINNLNEKSIKNLMTLDESRALNTQKGGTLSSFFSSKPKQAFFNTASKADTSATKDSTAGKSDWFSSANKSVPEPIAETPGEQDAGEHITPKPIEPSPALVSFVETVLETSTDPNSFFCPSQDNSPNAKALNEQSNPKSQSVQEFRIKLRKVLPGTQGLQSEAEREELRQWMKSSRTRHSREPKEQLNIQAFDSSSSSSHKENRPRQMDGVERTKPPKTKEKRPADYKEVPLVSMKKKS